MTTMMKRKKEEVDRKGLANNGPIQFSKLAAAMCLSNRLSGTAETRTRDGGIVERHC
jgi:hypothetical protein